MQFAWESVACTSNLNTTLHPLCKLTAKESRLKEMSIRHNLAVCAGEGEEPLYRIKPDMMGRTIVIDNVQGQQVGAVCFLLCLWGYVHELVVEGVPGLRPGRAKVIDNAQGQVDIFCYVLAWMLLQHVL